MNEVFFSKYYIININIKYKLSLKYFKVLFKTKIMKYIIIYNIK